MGYSGLENWSGSDMAADLVSEVMDNIVEKLEEAMSEEWGEFNTSGAVNVALFVEAFIYPSREEYAGSFSEGLYNILVECEDKLRKTIEQSEAATWEEEDNRKYHLEAYMRLLGKVSEVVGMMREEAGYE